MVSYQKFFEVSQAQDVATLEQRLIDFLRDVGKHFSINEMIRKESVRTRLEGREQGISFTEFSYQLLQANDYGLRSNRERDELETKLQQLGLAVPWKSNL